MSDLNQTAVTPSLLAVIIRECIKRNEPAFIWGAPGIGKSAIVKQEADKIYAERYGMSVAQESGEYLLHKATAEQKKAGAVDTVISYGAGQLLDEDGKPTEHRPYFIDIRASLLDPVDLVGVPSVENGRTMSNPPMFLPADARGGVVFHDELPQGTESVQSALLQWILDRQIGTWTEPENWTHLAAGNRVTDGTFSRKLSKALSSRFATHVDLECNLDDFCTWAIAQDLSAEVVSFVRWRPELLHKFDAKAQGNSFPCPRVWEKVSKFVGTMPFDAEVPFLSGALGDGAAGEFMAYLKIYRNLPSPDAILLDPKGTEVPTDPATQYALCGAMARRTSEDNTDRVFTYMTRLPVEMQVVWLRDTVTATPKVASTKEFVKWASENGDLLV
jgi:hypothetical protein